MKKKIYDFVSMKRLCVGISLCCMVAGVQAAPTSSAFEQRFNVEIALNNTTLKSVVNALKKQTDVVFSYDSSLEALLVNNVSLKAENESIEAILDQAFNGTGIKYKIEDHIVVLYSGSEKVAAKTSVTQQKTKKISGIIKDATGEPIIGANVLVKGTTNGVITGMDGDFSLEVPDNSTLEISYIGYVTQNIPVSGKNTLNIILTEDTQKLDEIVVLGYGAGQRKQDLSASVGVLNNTEDLVIRPVSSTEGMLQGQLAGVTVQANGGDPTKAPSIVIRGQGSQNGDNVLWVVDGVPGAPIASMNDIESIVVLKDAASAAIYGAQSGAGGVILVTTKKAKQGAPSLTYDATFGIRQASNLIDPLNAEGELEMRKLSYANAGLTLPTGWDLTKNPWVGTTRTDWMDEIFRTAFYQRHNVALNVGSENYSNRLSFSYDNDEGVLINTFNKNLSLRYNGKFKLNKWVTITEDFVWKNNENRTQDTESAYTGGVIAAMYMPASATVYNPLDGTYGGTTTEDPAYIAKYGSNFADIHGDAVNPVRLLEADNRYHRNSDTWSTTSLELANIVPGLKFTSRFTYNMQTELYKNFSPIRDEVGKPALTNTLKESTYRRDAWKTENTLTYDNTFDDKHTIGVLLSTTADHYGKRSIEIEGKDLSDESAYLQYLSYANSTSIVDALEGPDANVSFIGRLAYSFDDRYFVTASWRRDYAGRLPKDNNYGDFPAVTAGWKISNESFFPKSDVLNLLKIRASWGRVGNLGSIGYNYKSALLAKSYWLEQAQYGVESNKTWGNFVYNSTALNPNLTWETSEQWDLGLDMNMFNSRLNMSFDYFDKRTFNLIQSQTMNWPNTIGINAMLVNQGEVRNRGFEAQVSWSDHINKDWSYFVSGNFSYLKNWVSDIGVRNEDGTPGVWTGITKDGSDFDGSFRNLPYMYQTAEGEPLASFYLIRTDGIFQSDAEAAAYVDKDGKRIQPDAVAGDLKFIDYNGDGVINDKDRQYCGSATPKTTFSFTGGFTWKKLSVSAMFQGVGGAQALYVGKYMALSDVEGNFNRSKEIMNAWSPTNTSSNIPRLSKNDPNSNFSTPSDWYLENASYLRLKNLTLSYNLDDVIRKCSHLKERNSLMSVYLSGENLFTITNYSGMDPECGGWDALRYPVSRVFSVGVKITY